MKHQFSRNELAYGQEGLDLLKQDSSGLRSRWSWFICC